MNSRRLIGVGGCHIVPLVNPASVSNATVTSDAVSLRDWDHLTILLHFGTMTTSLDCDLTIYGDTAASATHNTALATINFRKMTTSDTWGAITTVTDSKLDIAAGGDITISSNQLVAIEIDAAEILALSTTYDLRFVYFTIDAGGAYAYILGAQAILSRGTRMSDIPATVIA
ncbi:MAG: hypothetical protein KJ899_15360 [Gammaproteobacteria bacterium]|nr:hypothetical protein [Gammaproteobacteria bacterium]